MADSRWWKDFNSVIAALQPAGSRVIDVGCGDGGLVGRLGELGFDALGVNPAAPAHPRLIRQRIEQVTGLSKSDATVAVMSLHHADLDAVISSMAGMPTELLSGWLSVILLVPTTRWLAGAVNTMACTGG